MIKIAAVKSKADLKAFIDFPHELYKNDPHYVPELFIAQRDMLSGKGHPFYEHSNISLFLAYEDDKLVGRIAAIENNNHNKVYEAAEGFFGFFDTINSEKVANALISTAENVLKSKGLKKMIGPVNFSTNEVSGLLVEGFDGPPVAMMPYNASYYQPLLEKEGLTKKVDLRAYRFTAGNVNTKAADLTFKIEERLKRNDITIRKINLKNFKAESEAIRKVYNKAWDKNLGFVPMTENEFNYAAKDLKLIIDPEFCLMAERHGEIVGFALAIPDINQVLIKIKRGRLFPTGLLKLLLNKKKINGIRILLLGVVDGYRKMGIEVCLYGRLIARFQEKNMKYAEASWTLEHNDLINKPIESIGGQLYRKYRLLEKSIA